MSDLTDNIDFCDDDDDEKSLPTTCNRCGKRGLEWVDCGGRPARWRLFDGKKLHVCSNERAAEDFEDVT